MPSLPRAVPTRYCRYCRRQLHRKLFGSRLEDRAVFLRRKYCDTTCMSLAFRKIQPTLGALRKRAVRFRKLACEECGIQITLSIHHLDGNPANNDPLNLKTLCNSCHQKWHWAHGRINSPNRRKALPCTACGQPSRRWGMCQKHFQRWKKYGDPHLSKTQGAHPTLIYAPD